MLFIEGLKVAHTCRKGFEISLNWIGKYDFGLNKNESDNVAFDDIHEVIENSHLIHPYGCFIISLPGDWSINDGKSIVTSPINISDENRCEP